MIVEYENLKKANEKFFSKYTDAFNTIMESGWYILGNSVKNFEIEFASFNQSNFCIGVANGLDALTLSIQSFNFPKDSEIIVPANTYIATILSIVQNGMKPILVEPDIRTYNIDVDKIEEKISKNTVGIMVVHLYGKACNMQSILHLAKKYDLKVFEDCAQSHGAEYSGQKTGTFGDFGCFSFYPTKNLGALGDAGAVTTDNEEYAKKIITLRNYGSKVKYVNDLVGVNSRLDELQAALLSVKLKYLDEITNYKRKLADYYLKNLKNDFIKPVVEDGYFDVYHIFNIRHAKRNELKEYLLRNNIKTEIHYPIPPHKQKAMLGIIEGEFPISEAIHNSTLSLPISFATTFEEIEYVVSIMNKF